MGLGHHIDIELMNKSRGRTFTVKNPRLHYGKWYLHPEKHEEIGNSAIEGRQIASKSSTEISSCGRSDASAGTVGGFEIWDGERKVGSIS